MENSTTDNNQHYNTPHDEFDWSISKKNVTSYDESTQKEYEDMYVNSIKTINEHEIINGEVVSITSSDVVINVGFKSDGLVSLSEFRDVEDLVVGQRYDLYVMSKEDKNGHLILSRRNAKLFKAWENIKTSFENEEIVTGLIKSKTKGGLIADVFGLETFLPGSQIDVKPITDYDQYVGKTLDLKIVKINELIKNAVVSHKALIEADLEGQRAAIVSQLEKGQVLEGVVKNITDFGAFMDLGGVDGLLYITDISWGRINHPSEVLAINDKVNVVVLDFDNDRKRISLGMKQLSKHPWEEMNAKLVEGEIVEGKIVNIEDYGAFLEITPGVEGLIHISEVSWSNQPTNSREFFTLGETLKAKIMTVDNEERKMSLSIKKLQEDPWSKVSIDFAKGTKHTGLIKNITPFGVFVELAEGIGGMVHISDLSWTKRFNHPNEFTSIGEKIDVIILDIEDETRKITLGHKQIEEDPWDTFEGVFSVGSVHEATVIRRNEVGAEVLLPYGLEAFSPTRHAKKADGSLVDIDEKYEFKVVEFDRNEKKIIVSHTKVWEGEKEEEYKAEKNAKKEEAAKTKKAVTKLNKSIDKSTLGDLDALQQLRDQLDKNDK